MNLSGVVLAGGKSTRFGSNKAFAKIDGKQSIAYSIELLKNFTDDIVISGDELIYGELGYKCVEDKFKNVGPLGGIYSALSEMDSDYCIILTCDMPFITISEIELLLLNRKKDNATFYNVNDKTYPFPGVYAKELKDVLLESIQKDDLKVSEALKNHTNIIKIDAEESRIRNFQNINYLTDIL